MAARVALMASWMASPAQRDGWHSASLSLSFWQTSDDRSGSQMLLVSPGATTTGSAPASDDAPPTAAAASAPLLSADRSTLRYDTDTIKVKVKFPHTRYRALGPELIPVYRQSARR